MPAQTAPWQVLGHKGLKWESGHAGFDGSWGPEAHSTAVAAAPVPTAADAAADAAEAEALAAQLGELPRRRNVQEAHGQEARKAGVVEALFVAERRRTQGLEAEVREGVDGFRKIQPYLPSTCFHMYHRVFKHPL